MRYSLRNLSACAISCLFYCFNPAVAQQISTPTNIQLEIETETGARCKVFSGGPTLGVTGGNQPLSYFNTAPDENPQDFFGMISLSIPLDFRTGKARDLCYKMADVEVRKKRMDVYLELFERGAITKDEMDIMREELFPVPNKGGDREKLSNGGKPQAIISYDN